MTLVALVNVSGVTQQLPTLVGFGRKSKDELEMVEHAWGSLGVNSPRSVLLCSEHIAQKLASERSWFLKVCTEAEGLAIIGMIWRDMTTKAAYEAVTGKLVLEPPPDAPGWHLPAGGHLGIPTWASQVRAHREKANAIGKAIDAERERRKNKEPRLTDQDIYRAARVQRDAETMPPEYTITFKTQPSIPWWAFWRRW